MFTAQLILLTILILGFFLTLNHDINGRAAVAPRGFGGVVASIVIYALLVFAYVKAGALSLLIG